MWRVEPACCNTCAPCFCSPFDLVALAATALTLVAVPLLYYEYFKNRPCPLGSGSDIEKIDPEKL